MKIAVSDRDELFSCYIKQFPPLHVVSETDMNTPFGLAMQFLSVRVQVLAHTAEHFQ